MTEEEDRDLYGPSRPLWQRIIIYLFLASALYFLVVYFVLPNKRRLNLDINSVLHKPTPTIVNANAKNVVKIQNFAYDPGTITIKVGEDVVWLNEDGVSHTAVADDGSFTTGILDIDQSKAITFEKAGVYKYHCTIHPNMHGVVVVK